MYILILHMYSRYSFEEQMYICIYICTTVLQSCIYYPQRSASIYYLTMHTASFAILLNTQICLADEDQEAGKHRGEQGTHRPFSARIIIQDHGGLARNRTQI